MKTEDIRSISGADAMRHCDEFVGRGEGYLTAGDLPDDTAECLRALAQDTFAAASLKLAQVPTKEAAPWVFLLRTSALLMEVAEFCDAATIRLGMKLPPPKLMRRRVIRDAEGFIQEVIDVEQIQP